MNTTPDATWKWATFTYVSKETRVITKLFKNTNLHIAYTTKNTLQKHLQLRNIDPDKYNHSSIYELQCNSCHLKYSYIGQTGRNFKTWYKEHIHAIHTNKTTSKYAQHIFFFVNPLLFASCTNTFSKWCKITRGMKRSAQ
jgi:hypothetical protein